MYLENINETHVFSSFGTTFINSQAKDIAKTITFTEGYNLDSNLSFKVLFKNGHITSTNTAMTLNNKNIKVYIRGTLSNLPTHEMTVNNATVYTSLQEGTILELFYDGSSFVIVGNPIIYSSDDYEIYANGDFIYKKKSYTTRVSSGIYNVLLGETSYTADGQCNVNVSTTKTLKFNSADGTLTTTKFCGTASSATNSTCFGGCTYACAKADIRNYTPSCATNSGSTDTFGGYTYEEAKEDIRNYTPSSATNSDKGWDGTAYSNFGSNAFNSTEFTTCTGTVTSVNVSVNGVSGTAVTDSGTITLTNVNACNSECFGGCTYAQAKADFRNYHPTISQKLGDINYFCASDSTLWTGCIRPSQYVNGIILQGIVVKNSDSSVIRDVDVSVTNSYYSCALCHSSSTICVCEYCHSSYNQECIYKSFCYCISDSLKNQSFFIISTETCPRCALDMTFVHKNASTGWVKLDKCFITSCTDCAGCKFNANIYFVYN